MNAKPRPTPTWSARNSTRVGFVVAVLAIIIVAFVLNRPTPKTPTSHTKTADYLPAAITPESFQNFIGPITEVGADSLAVRMTIVRPGGTHLERDYEVRVSDSTDLSLYYDRADGATLKPAVLSDFTSGDRVIVYGQENLYTVTSFTAVKVYKIVP